MTMRAQLFGFCDDFEPPQPPPHHHHPPTSPVSLLAECHTLNLGSLWPKSWWVASLCLGAALVSRKWTGACLWSVYDTHTNVHMYAHTHTQSHTHTHMQIYSKSLLDLWLASVLHSTSQGWLLFCSSSKKVRSPFPLLLFLPVFFHCRGRNCGWEFKPSLSTACPDY